MISVAKVCEKVDELLELLASELPQQVNAGLLPKSALSTCRLLLVTDETLTKYRDQLSEHVFNSRKDYPILEIEVVQDSAEIRSDSEDVDWIVPITLSYDNEEERPSIYYELGGSWEDMRDGGVGTIYLDC